MRVPLIAGNWKMNGRRGEAVALADAVVSQVGGGDGVDWVICPPFVHLDAVGARLAGSPVTLGAQNVCDRDQGAATGEVSGDMLGDLGCRYTIVGHSERRTLYGESDAVVAARFAAAKRHGLVPILCVGETLSEREADQTVAALRRQVEAVFELCGERAFDDAVIAYEPVWAIGTGRTATPEQAQDAHARLRAHVGERDPDAAQRLRILYGGSMKPANAEELLALGDVDGGLIGGASLDAEAFAAIAAGSR